MGVAVSKRARADWRRRGAGTRSNADFYGMLDFGSVPNRAKHRYPILDICHGICHMKAMTERHVKLFKNGRNQAVRIPREFELPGEDAIIRKEGQRLIIEAAPPRSLLAVLATLQTLDED